MKEENYELMYKIPEFTVSQFSSLIKRIVEDNIGYIKIRGEIVNFKKAASGHLYFSLQDKNSLIYAVCFKNMAELINISMEDGLEVAISGQVTTYSNRSNYQIIVEKVEIAGTGSIMAEIEKRKKRLLEEGLFDTSLKKKLPLWPDSIAVITSKTGSVIEDIIHRIKERFPTNIILYPVSVQGIKCSKEIITAINYFNNLSLTPDIIIIARGGGSFEDLLPFNDENLVRTIFTSKIPVISAIGHETDTVLIDYVSDVRAPTPTAAAEIATPVLKDYSDKTNNLVKTLNNNLNKFLSKKKEKIENLLQYLFHPKNLLENNINKINNLEKILLQAMNSLLFQKEKRINNLLISLKKPELTINDYNSKLFILSYKLNQIILSKITNYQDKINLSNRLLHSYNYNNVLKRGYSLIRDKDNKILYKTSELKSNKILNIEMSDGDINIKIN